MKKAHLKIVLVMIFAALLSGCTWLNTETEGGISRGKLIVGMMAVGAGIAGIVHSDSDSDDTVLPTRPRPPVEDDDESDPTTVANVPPEVSNDRTLAELNRYATAIASSEDAMRMGGESADVGDITSRQYNDPDGNPRVVVRSLDFANMGIWINGGIADADFDFAYLNENGVAPPTSASNLGAAAFNQNVVTAPARAANLAEATYALEGEMTYRGNRFYPDGALMADFANAQVSGEISLDGAEADDDFGLGRTTLADGAAITNTDNLTLGLSSAADSVDASGFSGALNIITAEGFFASLLGRPAGDYSGRFNDDIPNYDAATAAPQEVSGIFGGITDANGNELKGGFLGQCSADCRLPISRLPNIGISSTDRTAQERNGQIVLEITSDTVAPTGGLAVRINIGGSGVTANEFTATGPVTCTDLLVCTVTIPATMLMVELTLTPIADFDTEGLESWTATLEDGSNYNLDAGNNNVGFDITDLIAALGIATSNTEIIEGGAAVTLTITSSEAVPAALTNGLSVTINIVGADNTDFTSDTCTNTECVITIPIGMTTGILTITASTDSDAEGGSEVWTATIAPDMFTVDSDAVVAVANMLPPVMDSTTLADLNAYAMSVAVAAPPFRQGGNSNTTLPSSQTLPIVEAQYNDASGNPQILTQRLQFAALGVWVSGDATAVDGFQYASLADDVVAPPITTAGVGTATYDIEGDAVYKGLRFYPDGTFNANFDTATISGAISVRIGGSGDEHAIDDFGTATPTLANGTALTDNLILRMQFMTAAPITEDGFSASDFRVFFVSGNHFTPLSGDSGQIDGRFHAGTGHAANSAPPEMSGTFSIMDGTTDCDGGACELKGGFLGDSR